jgi:hypothetical protein
LPLGFLSKIKRLSAAIAAPHETKISASTDI